MAPYTTQFPLMGGTALLGFVHDRGRAAAERVARAAQREALRIERRFSRFRPGSLVERINAAAGRRPVRPVHIDEEAAALLRAGLELGALTGGRFDVTVGALWPAWDRAGESAPTPEDIAALLPLVDASALQLSSGSVFLPRPGMALDLGGLAKEYAADAVADLLVRAGVRSGLVNFAGDLRTVGSEESGRPWSVGVADPRAPSRPALELHVPRGGGVATSGTYERGVTRGGVRYHHLLDARTGWPAVTGVASATAIAATTLHAGQFATAALLLGPESGLALLEKTMGIEGVILTEDGAVLATSGARQERNTA